MMAALLDKKFDEKLGSVSSMVQELKDDVERLGSNVDNVAEGLSALKQTVSTNKTNIQNIDKDLLEMKANVQSTMQAFRQDIEDLRQNSALHPTRQCRRDPVAI